ncbi:ATP-dependent DNA helicase pif1-like [Cotesia typhae]|uniref:ATP-dependent DNA helicase pif1-like n=1 Tax=Cotesia typhae TaxID=2053667 RepID=UPI003D69E7AE
MERESRDVELIVDIVYNQCLILLEDIVTSMSVDRSSVGVSKLNDDQKQVYDEVLNSIDSNSGKLFFLDAPGGTGKTFLINLLLAKIRSRKNIAVAVASSGIAATLIDGGKTAHSAFKLPLNLNHSDNPICNISKQSDMAHVLRETKIIVWDECTMAHKKGVEALNQTLQDIREYNRLMGGLTILLAGDFRQTLPVVPRGTRADEIKACLKSLILWPNIKVLSLKVNMRVCLQNDLRAKEFSELLIDIGNGNLPEEERKITIPSNLCETVGELITLIDRIYPNIQRGALDSLSWLKERAILTPINESADRINTLLIERQTTEHMKYESVDTVIEVEETVHYPVEFLHTLNPPGIPPHILHLKIGTSIMLRNLNPPKLCNGTRLQVKTLRKNLIEATIFTGKYEGENVFIPRIPLIPSDYHFKFKRLQFPVRVCFVMSINKAQGQSLKLAGVDLQSDCFSHGQFYVACSRVSSSENLIILQPEKRTKNVVYKEVLNI